MGSLAFAGILTDIQNAAKNALDKATETAQDAKDQIDEALEDASEKLGEAWEDAGQAASDYYDQVSKAASKTVDEMTRQIEKTYSSLSKSAADALDKIYDKAGSEYRKAIAAASSALDPKQLEELLGNARKWGTELTQNIMEVAAEYGEKGYNDCKAFIEKHGKSVGLALTKYYEKRQALQ